MSSPRFNGVTTPTMNSPMGSPRLMSSPKFVTKTYTDKYDVQSTELTEEIELITIALQSETQGFLSKVYTEFTPLAYRFNENKDKFKIKVKVQYTNNTGENVTDYVHIIGNKGYNGSYELSHATSGNEPANEL
jgi:hypothetical protein